MNRRWMVPVLLASLGLGGCGELAGQAAVFTLDVTPHEVTAARGEALDLTAHVTRGVGLSVGIPVNVTRQGDPPGVQVPAVRVGAGQTSASMPLQVTAGAAPGAYTLVFQGDSGLQQQTTTVTLTVKQAP